MQQRLKRWGSLSILIFWSILHIAAQTDTVELHDVIVSSFRDQQSRETSMHIEPITLKKMEQSGAFNISDALAKIPGISQLTTGVAISKPVIHGLYGNRVLVLISGMRFDNQQWQDEHGLGLSDVGISKVELIKGPFSLLHGTEAVGGVVNIIEENKPEAGMREQDFGLKLNTNTMGGLFQYGYKVNHGNSWSRIRFAAESNADYSDGKGTRVLNSRFDGYYLKGTYGFKKNNWTSENNYLGSINRFGFIFADINDFFVHPDARWSRDFPGPHHIVVLNIGSSQNTIALEHATLKLNVGVQSNMRLEDEGSGSISLFMHLITGEYTCRWIQPINAHSEIIFANISSVEKNTNYGKKVIVPDAWMAESSIAVFLHHAAGNTVLEIGAGGGSRYIKTLLTPGVNSPEKDIDPFTINNPFGTAMLGISMNPSEVWNIKGNIASGVRCPNLAELSSNGLHEGVFTYEIGNPYLKNEMNINSDISMEYPGPNFRYMISGFYNHFFDYIYLSPTEEEWFGFPIYRYRQQDANLYGGELSIGFAPEVMHGWMVNVAYSGMIGKTDDGNFLPFIPAQKLTPEIRYEKSILKKLSDVYAFINCDLIAAQNDIAPAEIATGSYQLLNAGLGGTITTKNYPVEIGIAGNNLLNQAYFDHLSRFKSLGYRNIGTNITLHCNIKFSKQIKNKII